MRLTCLWELPIGLEVTSLVSIVFVDDIYLAILELSQTHKDNVSLGEQRMREGTST